MQSFNCKSLNEALVYFNDNPSIKSIHDKLDHLTNSSTEPDNELLLQLYKDTIPLVEAELWRTELSDHHIKLFQNIFMEMEAIIGSQENDKRYKFIIIIPVADRPQHLRACLDSLLELCKIFNYGGYHNGKYSKIAVIIADDSKLPASIGKHQEIAQHFTNCGLDTDYFGIEQQLAQIDTLDENDKRKLSSVLGNSDRNYFFHKGASITRNITYLKLNDITETDNNVLFFFIDSDQEFCIKANTEQGDRDVFTTNYFYYLNEIFSTTDSQIITGKVVGDPPVSPAVMTSNFLDDVIAFFNQISQKKPYHECEFHNQKHQDQEGAYHDMATLFGFDTCHASHHYHCTVLGNHDHRECLHQFSNVINNFFYGEHLTRSSYFHYEDILSNLKPARTIYTGNYVLRAEQLKYFIPFATLKLRMAGPVLGRLIQAEIGERFISANLPMLHKRTVEDTGQSEFRPGIEKQSHIIDLFGEFQRQYFGDVLLFSVVKLTALDFPIQEISTSKIIHVLETTEKEIHQQYVDKHLEINTKLSRLQSIFTNTNNWLNTLADMDNAKTNLTIFINNIEHNFGDHSKGYQLLCSSDARQQQLESLAEDISHYKDDRLLWEQILSEIDK